MLRLSLALGIRQHFGRGAATKLARSILVFGDRVSWLGANLEEQGGRTRILAYYRMHRGWFHEQARPTALAPQPTAAIYLTSGEGQLVTLQFYSQK